VAPAATRPHQPPRAAAALAGVLALGLALGVAELAAAFVRPQAGPVVLVGSVAIDSAPAPVKEWAVRTLGTADKPVLVAGILVVLVGLAAALGVLATRRRRLALAGVAALGAVPALALLASADARPTDVVPAAAAAAVGVVALRALAGRLDRPAPPATGDLDRRGFLVAAGTVAAAAVATGAAGRVLVSRWYDVAAERARLLLPRPASPALPLPADADLGVAGVPPFHTPNADFYRVDVNLVVPRVQVPDWRVRVHGMVDRELELDLDALLARDLVERDITLTCVSNEVGGPYAGTARWLGAPLRDLLLEAGVRPGAEQLVSRAVDGFTIGTPVAAVLDGRDALLAVGMNGEPLPAEHGFPVRMVVPGLFGFVSATKWVVDLELTTYDAYDAYWTQRGWATDAPVLVASRIDTPRPLARLVAGPVAVGGVAWAQHRGIDRVEVRVDGGPWQEARLGGVPSVDTWRQWVWEWEATPGRHALEVRATDGTGVTQTAARSEPFPAGATGWHSVVVTVS
jgi:DMSO/TMAO reductase YedYZ molybdopterin-dependent catalytic subunit